MYLFYNVVTCCNKSSNLLFCSFFLFLFTFVSLHLLHVIILHIHSLTQNYYMKIFRQRHEKSEENKYKTILICTQKRPQLKSRWLIYMVEAAAHERKTIKKLKVFLHALTIFKTNKQMEKNGWQRQQQQTNTRRIWSWKVLYVRARCAFVRSFLLHLYTCVFGRLVG